MIKRHPFPCILHWDNCHFVVLYKIQKKFLTKKYLFYISDPTFGLIKLTENQFQEHWCGIDKKGIGLLLTPGKIFVNHQPRKQPNKLKKM